MFVRCVGWVLLCWITFGAAGHAAGSTRPNILILLADDMGYQDPGCFGGTAVKTPNLDRLAAGGMKLTNFYAGSAVCTPSRVSMLTGRYPLRFDVRKHFSDGPEHLPPHVVTIARLLQQAGYQTAHVGKWHLGGLHVTDDGLRDASLPGPRQMGFDHYQCQIEQQPLRGQLGKRRVLYREGGTCLLRDDRRVGEDDPYYRKHFTDCNGDYAVEMIRKFHAAGRPFFLNVWWLVPHKPYEPAPEPHWSATAAEGISDDQHRFRSMVAHMDARLGDVLDTLDELGIADNTIVVFTSDNGGAYEADIGPYKGGKTDLHEGGLRVPAIVRWPGRVPAGATRDAVTHMTDLLPTLCAAGGVKPPGDVHFDGMNLLPMLTADHAVDPGQRTLFWQMDLYRHLQRHDPKPKPYSKEIMRQGPWKLMCFDGKPVELCNVVDDPGEQVNLLDRESDRVRSMHKQLAAWLAEPRDTRR